MSPARSYSLRIVAVLALLLAIGAARAGELSIKRYALPGLGTLVVPVPDAWDSQVRPAAEGLPPTLRFAARSGPAFELLVAQAEFARTDDVGLRRQVERMAKSARPRSTQRVLPIKALKVANGVGYYFSATVRQPAPGQYKFLSQGLVPVGNRTIVFTVHGNDGASAAESAALLLLRDVSLATAPEH
jgi:hypothetical protein